MDEQKKAQIIEIIQDVVGVDITSFDDAAVINTISEWDSFNNLMLISRFEEDMEILFTASDVESINSIGDLWAFLDSASK